MTGTISGARAAPLRWRFLSAAVLAATLSCDRGAGGAGAGGAPGAGSASDDGGGGGGMLVDEALARGLRFERDAGGSGRRFFPETMGGGAGLFDADGDGDLDLLLLGALPKPGCTRAIPGAALFRNDGAGHFVAWGDGWPASGLGDNMGCAVGDVDGDGDLDLFLANFGPDLLLVNEAGRFIDGTLAAGVGDARWATSAAFADVDGDGDLDLYVGHYVQYALDEAHLCKAPDGVSEFCEPDVFPAEQDTLWINDGAGRFADQSQARGLVMDDPGRALGVVFFDVEGDGDADLFVANDRSRNFLFVNDGTGHFSEEGLLAGVAFGNDGRARAGMGVDAGDFDGDGREDLVVANFGNEPATLQHNGADGLFEDVGGRTGVGAITTRTLGFGVGFLDFDLDGDLDLFFANGHVLDTIERHGMGQTYAQQDQLLLQEADGGFIAADPAVCTGLAVPRVGRAAVFGDIDNDGDTDILVAHVSGPPKLLVNRTIDATATSSGAAMHHHWLGLKLCGRRSNRDGYGACVEAMDGGTADGAVGAGRMGRRRIRVARAAKSYLATSDPRVLLGLGTFAGPVDVEIHWPSGTLQKLPALAADRYHVIVEPE